MGATKIDNINAGNGTLLRTDSLPLYPYQYYGSAANDVDSVEWRGGELVYNTTDSRLYIQTATSGTTPAYKRLLEQFVTP